MNLFKLTIFIVLFWTTPVEASWADVKSNVAEAAHVTDVDVVELAAVGYLESSFRPSVKAKRGSAMGLMQITQPTWNHLVRTYGEQYGIDGKTSRADPTANAIMAATYLKESRGIMERRMGRDVTTLEVYLGHKFGPYRATSLLKSKHTTKLVDFYPGAASRNKSVYYNRDGSEKTIGDVIAMFKGRLSYALGKYGELALHELALVKQKEFEPFAQAMINGQESCVRNYPSAEEVLAKVKDFHSVEPTRLVFLLTGKQLDSAESYYFYSGYDGCVTSGRKWRGHLV